jgi:hypothetical protein
MFHHDPNTGDQPILDFVYHTEFSTARFLLGLVNVNTRQLMTLKAAVTIQITPRRNRGSLFITDFFLMFLAFMGFT